MNLNEIFTKFTEGLKGRLNAPERAPQVAGQLFGNASHEDGKALFTSYLKLVASRTCRRLLVRVDP